MKGKVILIIIMVLSHTITGLGQKNDKSSKKITITGKVTGLDKKPVAGAFIFVDSLLSKSFTDEHGDYGVKVYPDSKIILAVVKEKGFGSGEITANPVVNITVTFTSAAIPDYVVRALKTNKKSINKAPKINTYPNIYEMIRVEVPGVTVSGTTIQIKQGHSFFGSVTPIFVVNGSKVSSIDYIIPTQVKKIEFLTGSQAAMYSGVDGTNGVIRITLFTGGEK